MPTPYPYNLLKLQSEDDRHWRFFCPFHSETEPSFTVNKTNPFKGFFRCWGCGINGSPKKYARLMGLKTHPIIEGFVEMRSEERPAIDWKSRLTHQFRISTLARKIGVSVQTIEKFGICYDFDTGRWLIPMYDETEICGIQETWFENGERKKKCQRYSKHGRFQPQHIHEPLLFIVEGWSDCATMTELEFACIGRFNALDFSVLGCEEIKFAPYIYIISDTDKVGVQGSKKLQRLIPNSKILYPFGFKDVREMFLKEGTEKTKKWIEKNL